MALPPQLTVRRILGAQTLTNVQEKILITAQQDAITITQRILADLEKIWQQTPPNIEIKRRQAWLDNDAFKTFFGARKITAREIQALRHRLIYIRHRLESSLHLIIIPQQTGLLALPCKTRRNAYAWWPRRIYLCPRWFNQNRKRRAAILVHEVVHQIGLFGQTHHGALNISQAKQLARSRPKTSRKSPENYEAVAEHYFK